MKDPNKYEDTVRKLFKGEGDFNERVDMWISLPQSIREFMLFEVNTEICTILVNMED